MTPKDKAQVAEMITGAYAYYRQAITPFVLDVWVKACETFPVESISKALSAHLVDPDRGQFAPKIADIIRILQGTKSDRAAMAWSKTLDAMSSVGAYSDVVFDDPAIHATVEDLGGWCKLCRTDYDELSYTQHRFTKAYETYVQRGTFDYPRRLGGERSPDEMYERRGLPVPRPAMVGDVEKCKQVLALGNASGKTPITFASQLSKLDALKIEGGNRP